MLLYLRDPMIDECSIFLPNPHLHLPQIYQKELHLYAFKKSNFAISLCFRLIFFFGGGISFGF